MHVTDNGRWPRHSADNLSVNNQTNLAIKGIIAIEAMSKMSSVVNRTDDANKYAVCIDPLYTIQWHSFLCRVQLQVSISSGRELHWPATSISLQRMGKATTRGLWVTICSRMYG